MDLKMDWNELSDEVMNHMSVRLMLEHDASKPLDIVSQKDVRAYLDEVFEEVMDEFLGNLKEDILHERGNIIDEAIDNIPHVKEE